MNSPENRENKRAMRFNEMVTGLWRLFSSIKLGIVLILFVTFLSLIGIFMDPVKFFQSWLFLTPGVLLMLNILVCSINRWRSIKTIIHGGKIKQPDSFFTGMESKTETTDVQLAPGKVSPIIERALHKQGYRVRVESTVDRIYVAADKNRYYKLGTYISHLSLILFVFAYIIGSSFGFRDTSFIVIEGETKEVGHDTDLSLSLISFVDEYYADNSPMDYRSQVILYRNGQEVDQALIQVNHPLIYEGVRFYQSFFGPAVRIQVKQNGSDIFSGNVALDSVLGNGGYRRNVGYLDLAESGLSIRFISSASNWLDPMIPEGTLAVDLRQNGSQVGLDLLEKEIPLEIGDIEFIYGDDIQYSGFQVSSDPGNVLIWIACSLFILGMTAVLYFTHRQLWILIQPSPSAKSQVFIRLRTSRGLSNAPELKRITGAIEKELPEDYKMENKGGIHGHS